ncbi:MAG: NUDIX domain-containing protein [Cyclobacteriaceae bacterium]
MELSSSISVDCVVFGYDEERLNVLLVERTLSDPPSSDFTSDWTLTGNHVYQDETIEAAASRVLFDLTGLTEIYLEQFKTFAHPERLLKPKDQLWMKSIGLDPTRRVVTVGFFALLATQQANLKWMGREVKWTPVKAVGDLAFDHNQILDAALIALRSKMKHEPIGFELLPEKFTLTQLQNVYEQIFDAQFDKRNFRKKINRMKYVIPLNEKQVGVPHKPAQLYMFSREVYEKTRRELFDFII